MALTVMEERRQRFGPDFWARSIRWVGLCTWAAIFLIFFASRVANAAVETVLADMFRVNLYQNWREVLTSYSLYAMVYLAFLSFVGIWLTRRRPPHKERKYLPAFRVLGILSLGGICVCLLASML